MDHARLPPWEVQLFYHDPLEITTSYVDIGKADHTIPLDVVVIPNQDNKWQKDYNYFLPVFCTVRFSDALLFAFESSLAIVVANWS